MPAFAPDFDAALILTYSPREGAKDAGYEDWLRCVDNPFFNGVPGIVRYTNWKIIERTGDIPYGYFDVLGLQDAASFEAVWLSDEVRAFTAGWRDKWGADPGTDSAINSHVYLCRRISGAAHERSGHALFAPGATGAEAGEGFQEWRIERSVKGDLRFQRLALKYVAGEDAFSSWREKSAAWSTAALGRCIAAPD